MKTGRARTCIGKGEARGKEKGGARGKEKVKLEERKWGSKRQGKGDARGKEKRK